MRLFFLYCSLLGLLILSSFLISPSLTEKREKNNILFITGQVTSQSINSIKLENSSLIFQSDNLPNLENQKISIYCRYESYKLIEYCKILKITQNNYVAK